MSYASDIETEIENTQYDTDRDAELATYTDQDGDSTLNVPVLLRTVGSEKDPDTGIVLGTNGQLAVMKKYVSAPLPNETFTVDSVVWTVKEILGDDAWQWLISVNKYIIPY